MKEGVTVPNVDFKYRFRTDGKPITYVDNSNGDKNPFEWKSVNSDEIFKNKRVVVFSLPGAFTPTCSTYQVPGFEEMYDKIRNCDIDEIYVISVNDTFVMRKWMIDQKIKNIKFIPDGAGEFTQMMGMLVCKPMQGFGNRSWRYAMVVNDGVVERFWEEPGRNNHSDDDDPYTETKPENVLKFLEQVI
jgi:peroxiredoxin|tara:strand:- start:223 stop:786 length:564 start_codon:yes stop_codon:yes gene_type:complete